MIYCLGDSFTSGGELPDLTVDFNAPSKFAWPAALDKLLPNDTVVNLAKGATGNQRSIKLAMYMAFKRSNDKLIIAWSDPKRSEFLTDAGIYYDWPGKNPALLTGEKMLLHKLVTIADSSMYEEWSYRRWLRDVIMLQSVLKQYNQDYIMIQSHSSQFCNRRWVVESNKHKDLADQIDTSRFMGWPLDGLVEYIGNTERMPNGHPSIEGHQLIAEKVYEYIRDIGWVS